MAAKILFCDNSLRELLNFREDVINYYLSIGCEVVLVAPINCEYHPKSSLVKVISVNISRSGKNPIQDLKYFNLLRKIYKKERPSFIFHYTIKPNIYGTLAARICRIPSSAVIAGLGYVFREKGIGNLIARNLYRFSMCFARQVLVLNAYNYHLLQTHHIVRSDKMILLQGGEGVNLEHFRPLSREKLSNKMVFLMIARLLYDKGYREYVEAAHLIKCKYPDCEFQLLGSVDIEYPNHVSKEQVLKDSEGGCIQYLGYSSNVIRYIQYADCIVLPSYHEGLSRVLMEAIAMGKPVITTDIPGCREAVENGKNGFLVLPQNVMSLTEGIEKFVNVSPELRDEMGRNSRRRAEEVFDIKQVIAVYQQITLHILN